MKKDLERLETQHESQKRLLLHLGEMEKMTEELSNAAQHGDLHACATLIKRGARINELDSAGYLPLYYACSFGIPIYIRNIYFGAKLGCGIVISHTTINWRHAIFLHH